MTIGATDGPSRIGGRGGGPESGGGNRPGGVRWLLLGRRSTPADPRKDATGSRVVVRVHRVLNMNGVLLLSTSNRTFTERFYVDGRSENPSHVLDFPAPEVHKMLRSKFPDGSCYAQESSDSYYHYSESCWVPLSERRLVPLLARRTWMKLRRKGDFAPSTAIRFTPASVTGFPPGATNQLWYCVKRVP